MITLSISVTRRVRPLAGVERGLYEFYHDEHKVSTCLVKACTLVVYFLVKVTHPQRNAACIWHLQWPISALTLKQCGFIPQVVVNEDSYSGFDHVFGHKHASKAAGE